MAFDQQNSDTLDEIHARMSRRLAEAREVMLGVLDNGAWVLIPDPDLRGMVARYVADAIAHTAFELGFADVRDAAEALRRGGQLPISLAADELP